MYFLQELPIIISDFFIAAPMFIALDFTAWFIENKLDTNLSNRTKAKNAIKYSN